jgi:signal transduction histidine kinase
LQISLKKPHAVITSFLLFLLLAYFDLITGYDLGLFVFYFIPISVISWFAGRTFAIFLSLFAAIVWFLVDLLTHHPYSNWTFPIWNAFVRWTSFVILALAISEIKAMLDKEKNLKQELSNALEKIKSHIAVARQAAEGDHITYQPVVAQIDTKTTDLDDTFSYMMKKLSEQKALERRLYLLERQAIMAETASHLAHEIRNPLNLIMLTAHHIGNQFTPKDELSRQKFEEHIKSLKFEVEQLSRVVSDFMAIGKPSEMHKTKFKLSEVSDQILVLTRQQMTNKNISFSVTGFDQVTIYADIEQLRLVFLNLIVNAIHAVSENGHIWLHSEYRLDNQIGILISDDGPGIDPKDLEKIFEPYFTRKADGTGLGLTLVRRIIEEHNGRIMAGNRVEGGAHFEITFPMESYNCQ